MAEQEQIINSSSDNIIQKVRPWYKNKIILIVLIIIFFAISFFVYYKYFALGTLRIKKSNDAKILIDDREYTNNTDIINVKLNEGIHNILVYYDDSSMDVAYTFNIKKLQTTELNIDLSKINRIALPDDFFMTEGYPVVSSDQTIVFLDKNVFKKIVDDKITDYLTLNFIKDNDVVFDVSWSPDKKKIYFEKIDENGETANLIDDLISNDIYTLSPDIFNVVWNLGSDKIAYSFDNEQNDDICIANSNGENWRKIAQADGTVSQVLWVGNNIGYVESNDEQSILKIVDQNGNSIKEIQLSDSGSISSQVSLTQDFTKIAYTIDNDANNQLFIIDDLMNNANKTNIGEVDGLSFLWTDKDNLLFLQKTQLGSNNNVIHYDFVDYSIANNNKEILARFDMVNDYIPTDFFVFKNKICFFANGYLYNFNYK